jgi:ribosomal protein S18 acetylase RimI-like enzyme
MANAAPAPRMTMRRSKLPFRGNTWYANDFTIRRSDNRKVKITTAMQIAFRFASAQDFDYCADMYFAAMAQTIRELKLDVVAHRASFRPRWMPAEVRIISRAGADVGWLQSAMRDDALFLGQLFVDTPFRRQGIGTTVLKCLIGEAARLRRGVTLGVVKTNPALRLYERLGFSITHQDERKFYMRREPAPFDGPSNP